MHTVQHEPGTVKNDSFHIFRRGNPVIATMVLCLALVGASAESLDTLGSVLPLQIAGVSDLPPGFLPRVLGVLLGISGFLYLSDPLLTFGVPVVGGVLFPSGLALSLPGELLTALWMATMGLNVAKWRIWREPRAIQPA